VDPENVDVQLKVVDMLHQEGRPAEAAATLEKLFEKPGMIPFRYREQLGSYYESKGETVRAREQYLAYIEGLEILIDQSPDNLNLRNLLARFCIDKNLELDRAEAAIEGALRQTPSSPSFLLTRARLHISRSQFQEALAILGGLPIDGGIGYDVHFFKGLAYLGLDDRDRARTAFERALEVEPSRTEARDELKKLETVPLPQ
jgi:tetratricopeptide (TPR) repeat protein